MKKVISIVFAKSVAGADNYLFLGQVLSKNKRDKQAFSQFLIWKVRLISDNRRLDLPHASVRESVSGLSSWAVLNYPKCKNHQAVLPPDDRLGVQRPVFLHVRALKTHLQDDSINRCYSWRRRLKLQCGTGKTNKQKNIKTNKTTFLLEFSPIKLSHAKLK